MKSYIGVKIIKAEPMSKKSFEKETKGEHDNTTTDIPGYKVEYPGGYKSWSPKEVFETAYREITSEEEKLVIESGTPF